MFKKGKKLHFQHAQNCTLTYLILLVNSRILSVFLSLFPQPNFGASLHILKVEIGGDAQSTGMDFA